MHFAFREWISDYWNITLRAIRRSQLQIMSANCHPSYYIPQNNVHDDVIKWKHFPRYWPFVRGIHGSPVNSPHKGQWHGALMFSLICARINAWVNNREAGDLRRHHAHYDVIVMICTELSMIKFLGPFYWHKLATIRTRISIYTHSFTRDTITDKITNFNGSVMNNHPVLSGCKLPIHPLIPMQV